VTCDLGGYGMAWWSWVYVPVYIRVESSPVYMDLFWSVWEGKGERVICVGHSGGLVVLAVLAVLGGLVGSVAVPWREVQCAVRLFLIYKKT
jgi:hypothetical protein